MSGMNHTNLRAARGNQCSLFQHNAGFCFAHRMFLVSGKSRLWSSCFWFNLSINLKLSPCLMVLLCFCFYFKSFKSLLFRRTWVFHRIRDTGSACWNQWWWSWSAGSDLYLLWDKISVGISTKTCKLHILATVMNWFPTVSFSENFPFGDRKHSATTS